MVGWHHRLNGREWVNSERWWRTGKPGVLQSMGLQRVWHGWVTEQQHKRSPCPHLVYFIKTSPLEKKKKRPPLTQITAKIESVVRISRKILRMWKGIFHPQCLRLAGEPCQWTWQHIAFSTFGSILKSWVNSIKSQHFFSNMLGIRLNSLLAVSS